MIRWGHQKGKQRFKCKSCNLLFTSRNISVSQSNRFVWFKDWIVGRQTIKQISFKSCYSQRTLKRYFHHYLDSVPVFSVRPSEKVNLLIDATYFGRDLCLVLYRDNTIKYTQLYRLTDGEWYEELKEDLENLLELGIQIESITCDGHKALLKAVHKVCKEATIQRCTVHIQRMCRVWLTMHPRSDAGISLKRIVGKLHLITNDKECNYWLHSLATWYAQYEFYVKEKSFNPATGRYWYKHKFLRRSYFTIINALPDLFHYLHNPRIPKSTNGLESFFGHLKSHITLHRGLSKQHRKNFIRWYLFLKNQ